MKDNCRIALIFGGRSGEHEVSLLSARSIRAVLAADHYEIIEIGITREGKWLSGDAVLEAFEAGQYDTLFPVLLQPEPKNGLLYRQIKTPAGKNLEPLPQPDVVFPVLHGTFGEDGTIQGLLELADVAYVSGGVLASAVGMDKALFKDVMRANSIPVVKSLLFTRRQIETDAQSVIAQTEERLPYPLFVKPANLGSSVGVSKCRNSAELMDGLAEAVQYDRRILVEQGIDAREIEVSVLGNENPRVSIPGEVRPGAEFYTYAAKYLDDNTELIIPAPVDPGLARQIQETALKACKLVDCAGMARVDFLLDRHTGQFFLHEINTIPGFTKISMYPRLWQASGLTYEELVKALIELALERKTERDRIRRTFR